MPLPANDAVTVCCPALKLEDVYVAMPCAFVDTVATVELSMANATEAPAKGALPLSSVAVKVTGERAGDGFALGVTVRAEGIWLTVTGALLQLLEAKLASPE